MRFTSNIYNIKLGQFNKNTYICTMVKFIKIATKHTKDEFSDLTAHLSRLELELLGRLYSKFLYVEYLDENELECIMAVIHTNYIGDLIQVYTESNLDFTYEDLTKDVFFSRIDTEPFTDGMLELVNQFIDDYLDSDIVLDKINECGIKSLTTKDKQILERV